MGKKIQNTVNGLPLFYKIILGVILLLPLLSYPPLFAPPAFGKSIVFRILFSIILLLFLHSFFFSKNTSFFRRVIGRVRAKKGFYFFTPLILLFFLTVSIIFSVDPNFSIFSDPSRGGGFLTFFLLIALAYLLYFVLDKENWKTAWKTLFFTGVVATFFAFLQWQGLFENIIVGKASRPYASFGNPTILGVYLAILVFPLLAFVIKEKARKTQIIYLFSLFIVLFGVALTYTRAAVLGIIAGGIYFALFLPYKEKLFKTLKIGFLALLILVASTVYYVNTAPLPQFVEESSFLRGLTNRMDTQKAFQDPRIGGFIIGWNAIKERPLTGYGVENFAYAFDRHYHPDAPFISKDVPWWDKAHNLPLEIGVWGGFPALIALLLLFVSFFLALRRKENEEKTERHAIQATLITFFVANFFTIDDFATYLLLAVILAYTIFLCTEEKEVEPREELVKRERLASYKWPFLLISVPLLFVFIFSFNIAPLSSNKNINIANVLAKAKRCETAINLAEEATKKENSISSYLLFQKSLLYEKCLEDGDEKIFDTLQKALEKRPTHTRSWTNLGSVATKISADKESERFLDIAMDSFQTAIEISPNRYSSHSTLAIFFIMKEEFEKAIESAEKCLELKEDGMCFFSKGVALSLLEKEEAESAFQEARERDYDIVRGLNIIINHHIHAENYEALIPLYLMLIKEEPEEAQHYSSLATTYRETGNYQKAREYALKALEIQPEAAFIVEEFLKTLPQ